MLSLKSKKALKIKADLVEHIKDLVSDYQEVQLISLCTSDGFNIKTHAASSLSIESDKVSAMASALCSLSRSAAEQVVGAKFKMTTIEADKAHILFISTSYLDIQCVLFLSVDVAMSLATARFLAKRLATNIAAIQEDSSD